MTPRLERPRLAVDGPPAGLVDEPNPSDDDVMVAGSMLQPRTSRRLATSLVLVLLGGAPRQNEEPSPKWSAIGPPAPNVVRDGPRVVYFPPQWCELERHTEDLRAMAEPSLIVDGKEDDVVYRFLLARSFHPPLAIRVERRKGRATLTAKRLGGSGGYNSPIEANVRRDLTDAEWTHAESALSAVPFTREPFDGSVLSNDGSDWVLERARDGRYLATSRHSPDADMPLRHACEILLDLAGRNILNGDLY